MDDSWVAFIEKEVQSQESHTAQSELPTIIRDLVTTYPSQGRGAAERAAHRIGADYREVFLPSIVNFSDRDDNGWGIFLGKLYGLCLSAGRLINYEDARQDAIVELFVQLRRLPYQIATIRNVSSIQLRQPGRTISPTLTP